MPINSAPRRQKFAATSVNAAEKISTTVTIGHCGRTS
jgi:hypothetical protein